MGEQITIIRPFLDRYGFGGVIEMALLVYLGSFLLISVAYYFLYFRPYLDPVPLRETHRHALRFSLVVLFVYLVWSDRIWGLLGGGWQALKDLLFWIRTWVTPER